MSDRTQDDYVTESAECPRCGAVLGEFCDTPDLKPHRERERVFVNGLGGGGDSDVHAG